MYENLGNGVFLFKKQQVIATGLIIVISINQLNSFFRITQQHKQLYNERRFTTRMWNSTS
jgi:hypothetical protein